MRIAGFAASVAGALVLPATASCNVGNRPALGSSSTSMDVVRLPSDADGVSWLRVSNTITAGETVQEFVPAGQSAADWTQIITVKNLPLTRDPAAVVDGTVVLMRAVCSTLSVVHTAHRQAAGDVAGLGMPLPIYDEAETLVTCKEPNLPLLRQRLGTDQVTLRRYEVTWYKVMKGRAENFIVQRGWHGDVIDGSVLGSREVLRGWKNWITRVSLVRYRRK
jgi:hypothetical protein